MRIVKCEWNNERINPDRRGEGPRATPLLTEPVPQYAARGATHVFDEHDTDWCVLDGAYRDRHCESPELNYFARSELTSRQPIVFECLLHRVKALDTVVAF